jgi:hypothetical protein
LSIQARITLGNPAQLTVMQRDLRKWRHCHGVD